MYLRWLPPQEEHDLLPALGHRLDAGIGEALPPLLFVGVGLGHTQHNQYNNKTHNSKTVQVKIIRVQPTFLCRTVRTVLSSSTPCVCARVLSGAERNARVLRV